MSEFAMPVSVGQLLTVALRHPIAPSQDGEPAVSALRLLTPTIGGLGSCPVSKYPDVGDVLAVAAKWYGLTEAQIATLDADDAGEVLEPIYEGIAMAIPEAPNTSIVSWPHVIKLRHPLPPFVDAAAPVTALTFQRGTIGALKATSAVGWPNFGEMIEVAGKLCGVPASQLNHLRLEDAKEVLELVMGFIKRARTIGKRASPS